MSELETGKFDWQSPELILMELEETLGGSSDIPESNSGVLS